MASRVEAASPADTPESAELEPLGRLARRIYIAQCRSKHRAVHSKFGKNLRIRFWLLNDLQRAWTFWRRHAGNVRRQRGVPVLVQALQLLKLALIYRADPATYYALNLYERPHRLDEVEHYVGRQETKSGLYSLIREVRRREVPECPYSLSDKAKFSAACAANGLPHIRILATAGDGIFTMLDETPGTTPGTPPGTIPGALERDLFVKLTRGRGTFGARFYRYLGDGRHVGRDEVTVATADLPGILAESSKWRPLIVNPYLRNHPEIADLATDSLLTFRVFTCFDAAGEPRVTHAMMRIMGKLEPSWNTIEEYGSKIDLATGRMDIMCVDRDLAPDAWWDRHPQTGAQVTGRILSGWPAIAALAVAAHRVFSTWVVIGWDLAWTPDGPVLIEGNTDPDPHYLQRVHRQMIGQSPLAPLLRHHLAKAAALLREK